MPSTNRTTTRLPSSLGKRSFLNSCRLSSAKDSGVEMLTGRPKKSDRAVEAAPIIWFMTSQTALMVISFSSNSSSGVSLPIRMSTMVLTSLRRSIMMLLPSRPETYLISMPMAGSRSPMLKSFTETTCTLGVVISTR